MDNGTLEHRYRILADNIVDVIWVMDAQEQKITYVSPSVTHMLGYTPEEIMEKHYRSFMPSEDYEKLSKLAQSILEDLKENPKEKKDYKIEIQCYRKDGSKIWIEITSKPFVWEDGHTLIANVSRDIDERKHAEEEILKLSYRDYLTGLYNRRFIEEEIRRLDSSRNLPISIISADLNRLKLVNDAFGHEKGDEYIIIAAQAMKSSCRPEDLIGRTGGDEFLVFLPKTSELEASTIVERMKAKCSDKQVNSVDVSISFGIATKMVENEDISNVVRTAEKNMYKAKTSERKKSREDMIKTLTSTLFQKSAFEAQHGKRVSILCRKMAETLGCDENETEKMALSGLLHDAGRVAVSVEILGKTKDLTEDDWKEIRKHAEVCGSIVGTARDLIDAGNTMLASYEHMDNKRYSMETRWEEVPISARIVAIAHCYETLTSQHKYLERMTKDEAIAEIRKNEGIRFDPKLAELFIEKILVDMD